MTGRVDASVMMTTNKGSVYFTVSLT